MACYIHNVPGRLRVKTPSIKGNQTTAEDLQEILRKIEGIDSTAVNLLTGSIVINYNCRIVAPEEILNALKQTGYVDPSSAITNDQVIETAVSKAGGVVGKALLGMLFEKALEGSALSLLTVLI